MHRADDESKIPLEGYCPMSPVEGSRVSLSKHYNLQELAAEIAALDEGMTEEEVARALPAPHPELANDLFLYDESGGLLVDTLVAACKASKPEAPLLAWVALLMADERLQSIVIDDMTTTDGKLDSQMFSKSALEPILESKVGGVAAGKGASNLLRWFETAGIATARRSGGSVVALDGINPTSSAVPDAIEIVVERLARKGVEPAPGPDAPVDLALSIGANHWLNLTPKEFRRAAKPPPAPPPAKAARQPLPAELATADAELRRKGQVILQGPPGVGKTYTFERYLDWFSAGNRAPARLSVITQSLAEQDRTASEVADAVQATGIPGVWEIAQFHAGYSYERFIRGLQAEPVTGGVTFEPVDRVFAVMAAVGLELAARRDDTELLLVIDEINRGDTARIFGELLYALEYRGQPVSTPYAIDGQSELVVPQNLFVLGTMNTADQSIAMVDKALRRRFGWISLAPDPTVFDRAYVFAGLGDRAAARRLFERVAEVFDEGGAEVDRLRVGHSYFLPEERASTVGDGRALIARKFAYDCWPLLEEYEAEGLIDTDPLEALLVDLGWSGDGRPGQEELRVTTEAWLGGGAGASGGP